MESRLNSLLQNKRLKRLARVGVFGLLIWFGLFRWNAFDGYGKGLDDKPFFSPNCEYYVTLHQTVWDRLFHSFWPDITGTAKLHDKTGLVLYSGRSDFEAHFPIWNEVGVSMPGVRPVQNWYYQLSTSPGTEWKARNCAKFDEETQELKAMTQQPELTMPLDECSFKFTNVFHGWFLNVSRYFRSPSASYEGENPFMPSERVTFRFSCSDVESVRQTQAEGAPLGWDSSEPIFVEDKSTGQWRIRPVELSPSMEKKLLNQGVMNQEQIIAFKNSRSGGLLQAVNAQGFYMLHRDPWEGRAARPISFDACLLRSPKALCVHVGSIGDVNRPSENLTLQVLELLQSVEFVPDPNQGQ
jgi:hypothetical protein